MNSLINKPINRRVSKMPGRIIFCFFSTRNTGKVPKNWLEHCRSKFIIKIMSTSYHVRCPEVCITFWLDKTLHMKAFKNPDALAHLNADFESATTVIQNENRLLRISKSKNSNMKQIREIKSFNSCFPLKSIHIRRADNKSSYI